jgi:hypothetical protein
MIVVGCAVETREVAAERDTRHVRGEACHLRYGEETPARLVPDAGDGVFRRGQGVGHAANLRLRVAAWKWRSAGARLESI